MVIIGRNGRGKISTLFTLTTIEEEGEIEIERCYFHREAILCIAQEAILLFQHFFQPTFGPLKDEMGLRHQ